MRPAAAAQHLRQIAALGLHPKTAIPEMLDTLGHIVPGAFNSFFWIDGRGQLIDAYAPTAIATAFEALVLNYDQLRFDGEPTFDKMLPLGLDVGSAIALHRQADYSGSVIRNVVWRAYGIGLGLDLILRDASGPRAILFVNREARQSRFTAAEARALFELRQHFLHALDGREDVDGEVEDAEDEVGVITADRRGAIVSSSPSAFQLMLDFLDAPRNASSMSARLLRELPPPLAALCDRLHRIRSGAPGPPAMTVRRTGRGQIRAKAFPLAPLRGEDPDAAAAIVLTRHIPRTAGMMRRLARMDLSPRERQLALQLGLGLDPDAAARAIGVSPTTGRGYLKSIYRRLGVAGRTELVTTLQVGPLG